MPGICESKGLKSFLLVFQVAGISLIVMNVALFGETLYHVLDQGGRLFEGTLFAAAVLNTLELINNWTSIDEHICSYQRVSLFAIDLLTLGLFYIQVFVLSRVMKNGGITDMVLRFQFLFITYVFLYIVYVVWNRMIIACEGVAFDRRRKVISVTEWREHQIFIGGALFCGLLALESLDLQVSPMTMSWIWALALWFYQGMAVVILFRSQKLTGMLKNAMEAMYK